MCVADPWRGPHAGRRIRSGGRNDAYDQAGHLFGEYDGLGNLIQETVWLGDIPVATIRPSGSSVAIYYVVTDQLSTPREVIRPSDNALMWTWFTGPFGAEAPNTNPQGAGNFAYDLRFPGQIAGIWGSTYQNYFRDLDPAVGRFIESDPDGLHAGVNTYAYVGDNPLSYIDPFGLDKTHVVNTAGGRSVWDGPTNGNWGGECWSGGQYSCKGHPMGKAPPTDSADACYKRHDLCYDKCNGNKVCLKSCNKTLVEQLLELSNDPTKWPQPPRKGTENDSARYRD